MRISGSPPKQHTDWKEVLCSFAVCSSILPSATHSADLCDPSSPPQCVVPWPTGRSPWTHSHCWDLTCKCQLSLLEEWQPGSSPGFPLDLVQPFIGGTFAPPLGLCSNFYPPGWFAWYRVEKSNKESWEFALCSAAHRCYWAQSCFFSSNIQETAKPIKATLTCGSK